MTSNLSKFLFIMSLAYLLQLLIVGIFLIFAAWQPARFLCLPGATLPIGLGRGKCYPMLDTTRGQTVIELLSVLLRMCLGLAEEAAVSR